MKVQLLVFEFFRGGRVVQKGHFRFTICNMAAKQIYLSIKEAI